jgi:hypothetical protein
MVTNFPTCSTTVRIYWPYWPQDDLEERQREDADKRHNTKFWVLCFREFLLELYGWRTAVLLSPAAGDKMTRPSPCVRSGTAKREWIFKAWVQKLWAS